MGEHHSEKGTKAMTLVVILLILIMIGAYPAWPHSKNWGYGPTGLLSTLLVVILILILIGRL